MKLTELRIKEKAKVISVDADPQIRDRIIDMGLVPGKEFKIVRVAPLGDPIEVDLGEFMIALRKKEADKVTVEKIIDQNPAEIDEGNDHFKIITEKLDEILLNRFLGIPIFLFIMWIVFNLTFRLGAVPTAWLGAFFNFIGGLTGQFINDPTIRSFVVDGVISGVGGVLVFFPNILLFFFFLSILQISGYLNRVSFVVDKVMDKMGLSGSSFLNMLVGFGCSVPAINESSKLKSSKDKLITMMVTPFMSCGAKLPIYILLISAFFPVDQSGNILFLIYMFGIFIALGSAYLLKTFVYKGDSDTYLINLPDYKWPGIKSILKEMWIKSRMYLRKAATVILIASIFVWAFSNYPQSRTIKIKYEKARIVLSGQKEGLSTRKYEQIMAMINSQQKVEQLNYSLAGRMGRIIEPVIKPLGFDWRIGISLLAGLAGKELVVSSLSTIYSLSDSDQNRDALTSHLRNDPRMNPAKALSLMIFVLLYIPCIPTTVSFHRNAGHWKKTGFYLLYTMTIAWVVSFIVYRLALIFI